MEPRLEAQLKALPAKPGVYLFRDSRGDVLYIGKAKSLRPRVRSYFQATGPGTRTTLTQLAERQAADKRAVGTIDVIGLAIEGDRAAVQVFPLRDGKLIDRYSFHLENVAGQDRASLLETFCLEYYGSSPSVPPQIVVPRDAGDTSALAEFLAERRGSRVEVRAAG